jgi:hypothetical protein
MAALLRLVLTTLLLTTLLLLTAMLTVLSIALPSLSVVPWAAWTVVTSVTVLRSSSESCTSSTGMVTRRVMFAAALLGVQKLALRPLVTVHARSDCVLLADRPRLLLLASRIPLSTTWWRSTIAGLTLIRLATTGRRRTVAGWTLSRCRFRRVLQSPRRIRWRRPRFDYLVLLRLRLKRLLRSLRHVR